MRRHLGKVWIVVSLALALACGGGAAGKGGEEPGLPADPVASWSTPVMIDRADYEAFIGATSQAPDGTFHVVWSEGPNNGYTLKESHLAAGASQWSLPAAIVTSPTLPGVVKIAHTPQGGTLLAWDNGGSGSADRVYSVHRASPGQPWSSLVELPPASFLSTDRSLLSWDIAWASSGGKACYVFMTGQGAWAAQGDTLQDTWEAPVRLREETGFMARVLALPGGRFLAVWRRSNPGYGGLSQRLFDGAAWAPLQEIMVPAEDRQLAGHAIQPKANGDALLVWIQFDPDYRFTMLSRQFSAATATWSSTSTVRAQDPAQPQWPAMSLSPGGDMAVLWTHGNDDAKLGFNRLLATSGAWAAPQILQDPSVQPGCGIHAEFSLSYDALGNLLASWGHFDASNQFHLHASLLAAGSDAWTKPSTLVSTAQAGWFMRLASPAPGQWVRVWDGVDSRGNAHILASTFRKTP